MIGSVIGPVNTCRTSILSRKLAYFLMWSLLVFTMSTISQFDINFSVNFTVWFFIYKKKSIGDAIPIKLQHFQTIFFSFKFHFKKNQLLELSQFLGNDLFYCNYYFSLSFSRSLSDRLTDHLLQYCNSNYGMRSKSVLCKFNSWFFFCLFVVVINHTCGTHTSH